MLGVGQVRKGGCCVREGQVRDGVICVRARSGKGGRGFC